MFGIDNIAGNDSLYTWFPSYDILLAFFEFLGPAVANYWGEKEGERIRHRQRKLDPVNQFLLTLMKLKLNLRRLDLAVRFGISESLVSRYITTWLFFCINTIKRLNGCLQLSKLLLLYLMPFMISTQLRLPLLMEVKCSSKLHQTFKCSHQHGVITNITTQQSF